MHCSYSYSLDVRSLTVWEHSAIFFLCATMVFPRSFVLLKLLPLLLFLMINFVQIVKKNNFYLSRSVLFFYLSIALVGVVWSIWGVVNGGAYTGIIESFRLYVIWSACFFIFFSFLSRGNALLVFHRSIVISGLLISMINLFAFYNKWVGLGIIPPWIIKAMDMRVGIHESYIHITSHNIGSLFFIVAYLLATQFRRDMCSLNSWLTKLSLLLCFVLVVISGRRALWGAILIVPMFIVFLSFITNSFNQLRGRKLLTIFFLIGILAVVVVFDFILNGEFSGNGTLSHIQSAFSSDDQRSIQKFYLIDGFMNSPFFGSGFGASAGYVRSEFRPWLYELTYHQMLFNIGIIGCCFLFVFFLNYYYRAFKLISWQHNYAGLAFCMIIAASTLMIGAYSNPYFGSFDFLLLLGVFPLISIYGRMSKINGCEFSGVNN